MIVIEIVIVIELEIVTIVMADMSDAATRTPHTPHTPQQRVLLSRGKEMRLISDFLRGEQILLALASRAMLAQVKEGQNVTERGRLPRQRRSAVLRGAGTAAYALRTGLLQPSAELIGIAARHGCVEGLRVLRGQDPPCAWSEITCYHAAGGGHLETLQWLRSQDPPCPWNSLSTRYARMYLHHELLQWAIDNGCPDWN